MSIPKTIASVPVSRKSLASGALAFSLLALWLIPSAHAESNPSILAPKAQKRLLLDSHDMGQRIVAVGQFGHILISEDRGDNWRQVLSPANITLTAVSFISEDVGFAVGYDSTILKSSNGGETWKIVYQDPEAKNKEAMQRAVSEKIEFCGRQEPDGCLFPLFGVHFFDSDHGIAAGAFGMIMETRDSGETWETRTPKYSYDATIREMLKNEELFEDEITTSHLNGIFADDAGNIYFPSEFGIIFKSSDKGESLLAITTLYPGSFWGGLSQGSNIFLYGMRGTIYRSENKGNDWKKVPVQTSQSLQGATKMPDGDIVITGLGGVVLRSLDEGKSFSVQSRKKRLGYAAVSAGAKRDQVVLFGDSGIEHHSLLPKN